MTSPVFQLPGLAVYCGDVLDVLRQLPADSIDCCVTSPPYYGLRDYGVEGQIGLEATPQEFIARLVEVFEEVRRVLKPWGTCWVNMGDSYAAGPKNRTEAQATKSTSLTGGMSTQTAILTQIDKRVGGFKPKDLMGMPWRLALALQEAGWWLRSEIIWCLSGGAWVYARTQKGDMPVMVKDLVRLEPSTVQLWNGEKWTRVIGWGPSNDTSQRLEVVLRSGERIGCTGGHLWPTQRGNVAARELLPGDVIDSCVLPEPEGCHCLEYLTADALWLAGLFLADGSWSGEKPHLSLSSDEQHWIPKIEAVAGHYGGSCTYSIDGGSMTVRLYGKVLAAILRSYIGGSTAIDKHFKVAAWRLPNAGLRQLMVGYLHGDGHDGGGNNRWRLGFCRNYSLERDLRTAAARLGATITLKPVAASYQGGELPAFRGEWRWERSGHHNEKDRAEIMEVRNSRARHFWDIAVEDEPHLFALASGVLTHNCKPAPMPESVNDRPTKAHEQIFLLTKREKYYYDKLAIAEPCVTGSNGSSFTKGKTAAVKPGVSLRDREEWTTRNARTVWTIGHGGFSDAHFATFPPEIPRRCILAGTSEYGNCAKCGKPWKRVTEKQRVPTRPGTGSKVNRASDDEDSPYEGHSGLIVGNRDPLRHTTQIKTTGWEKTCPCETEEVTRPVVLDPFWGSGTTGQVALELGCRVIGIELNPNYIEISKQRFVQMRLQYT